MPVRTTYLLYTNSIQSASLTAPTSRFRLQEAFLFNVFYKNSFILNLRRIFEFWRHIFEFWATYLKFGAVYFSFGPKSGGTFVTFHYW